MGPGPFDTGRAALQAQMLAVIHADELVARGHEVRRDGDVLQSEIEGAADEPSKAFVQPGTRPSGSATALDRIAN